MAQITQDTTHYAIDNISYHFFNQVILLVSPQLNVVNLPTVEPVGARLKKVYGVVWAVPNEAAIF